MVACSFVLTLLAAAVPVRGDVIISEFMAANHGTLLDEDGDSSDWIELYNAGTEAVDLAGWHLTDDPADLTKWTFPSTTMGANTFLIVFASGKDRAVSGAPLHTSFSLSSAGEYLALVNSNGVVVSDFAPAYPDQFDDVSYGVVQEVETSVLVSNTSPARILVPANASTGTAWTQSAFDDSGWRAGTNGVGYQNSVPGFAVKNFKANVTVSSTTDAESVISTPSKQTAAYSENSAVINYLGTSSGAHYANDAPFPGLASGTDYDDFVIEATGWVTLPAAGNWTFLVNSDDGFSLAVGSTFTMSFAGTRGSGDTLATFNFPTAGEYSIRLVYFERGGGSEVELSAIQGSASAWNSSFRLVGDPNGGLAVRSLPLGASATYNTYIHTDLAANMTNRNATAYLRIPFVVTNTATFETLTLLMRYDDGFIAYLNGTEVARRNAPATPAWNSTATATRNNAAAVIEEAIDLTPSLGTLRNGNNVLAIQGLNDSANGDDFLIAARLQEVKAVNLTNEFFAVPTPGTFNETRPFYAQAADTKFDHDRGFYETNFSLVITCATPGAIIRYTTDGSTPSTNTGTIFTDPILITNTTTLRAAAFKDGYNPSDVDTHTYLFIRDVLEQREGVAPASTWPAAGTNVNNQLMDYGLDMNVVTNPAYSDEISNDLRALPTFSLVMNVDDLFSPSSGIYVNPGQDTIAWERPCSLELIYPDGTKGFQANCGTRMRGGFSRDPSNPKHAFRFFFRSEYGQGQLNYPLCGTAYGAAQAFQKFDLRTFQNYSWSFQADSRFTGMRDVCNRDTQLAMEGIGSRGDYYHLYVNGQYWGIYNIDERPEANFGASYFGGTAEQYDVIKTSGDVGYNIYATDGSLDAWFRLWQEATNGFASITAYEKVQGNNPDGTRNPAYENLLDVDNLINYMLVHLYGNDLDAPISNFLNNESPNNIFCLRNTNNTAGFRFITHDAEHTYLLGNVAIDRFGPFPAGDPFATNSDGSYNGFSKSSPGYLWKQMTANPEFRLQVADRVQKFCFNDGVLTTPSVMARFMARSNELYRAVVLESARWGNAKRTPSFTRDSDWLAAVRDSASYIQQRTDLLLAQLRAHGLYPALNAPLLSQFGGTIPAGYSLSITNPNSSGQIYFTVDGSDPRLLGGAIAPTAQVYAGPLTLDTHTLVRVRIKDGADWSALVEQNFYVDQDFSQLIVSELMYNPLGGDNYEDLELKNVGDRTLDLSGLYFSSGISFTFTNGTMLAPGGIFLLVRDEAAFSAHYPGVTINGVYSGKLDNGGELIRLTHPLGGTLRSFTYNDAAPWPAAADGFGFSIVPVNANAPFDHDQGRNWRACTEPYGSPGQDDPAPTIPAVVVNEVLTHTLPPQLDAIELYNPTASEADVGGWYLTDDRTVPAKYRIPDPTIIPAGGYVVFDETQFNPSPGVEPSFSLSSDGEQVYLFSADASGDLTGYSHGFSFGAAALGVSFGRYLDSTGTEQFPAQAALSLTNENAGPLVGPVVINEIMYHPAPGGEEFVELKNITGNAVPLYDPQHTTNTWRLNGSGYQFPPGTQVAPNGFLLVVGSNPTVFRAKYSVPANVPIFGPFDGVLQDSGEQLELEMPGTPTTNGLPFITVDEVRYNDKAPWPVAADGDGPSLQRVVAAAFGNDPTNWFTSGITPGGDNVFNLSPTVALTSPTNNSSFAGPANLTLTATASDSDGTIRTVEFLQNGVKIGEAVAAPYSFVWTNVGPGDYTLTARAVDDGFATTVSSPIEIVVLPPPVGTGIGLKGEYYDNADLTGTLIVDTNATVNFDWGSGAPYPAMGVDSFSVRWTGMVQPRYSGTYVFTTTSDDGVRLWVNNQLLIDNWTDHGPTDNSGSINLLAGQLYNIRMEYYENGGGAVAQLSWSSTFVPREFIPTSQLYPYPLPSIILQPASRAVAVGGSVSFSVVATNNPTGYQWLFNDAAIPGATGPSLTIDDAQFTDAGNYKVVVSSALGSVTSLPASLQVMDPPVITTPPESQTVEDGATVTFEVAAGGTPPLHYQWRFFGTNLDGATGSYLVLSSVHIADAGSYSVVVSNPAGAVTSAPAMLSLSVPATIIVQPERVTIDAGGTNTVTTNTAVFSVTAVGRGALHYQWMLWGTNLPAATTSTLTLTNVSLDEAGPYNVRVTDSVQSVLSETADLTVLVAPVIYVAPQPQSVASGGTATLSVLAGPIHPTLPLTYQWRRSSTIIQESGQPTVILTNVTASGFYLVYVSNASGSQMHSSIVRVSVLTDSDGDGLPDSFENSIGLNPNDPSDGAQDLDGDGMSNAQEYLAGTDPTDPSSVLKITLAPSNVEASGQVQFSFEALSNKTYSVEYSDSLVPGGWSNLLSLDSLPTNRVIWVTNSLPAGDSHRSYRLKVPLNQ